MIEHVKGNATSDDTGRLHPTQIDITYLPMRIEVFVRQRFAQTGLALLARTVVVFHRQLAYRFHEGIPTVTRHDKTHKGEKVHDLLLSKRDYGGKLELIFHVYPPEIFSTP